MNHWRQFKSGSKRSALYTRNYASISIPRFVMDQSNDFQQLSQNNSENQFTMISSDYGSPKILSCFASALGDVDTPGGANHPLGDFPRLLPQNTISSHSSLVTGGTLSELGEVDPSILKSENDPTNILSYAAVSAMDTQMDGISPFDAQTNSFCAQLLNASGGSATCGLGTNAGLSNPYLNSVALGTAPDDKLISNYNGSFIPFTLNSLNASGNFADFINISTPFSSAGGIEKLGGMSGLSELSSFISPFPPFLGTPELSAGGMNSMMMMSDATLHCQNTTTNAGIGMLNQYDNYEHETLLRDFMSAKGCAMPNGLPAAASLASINNQQQSSANISSFMSQSIMSTNEQKTYHRQRNNAATSSSYDGLIGISDQESNSTSLKATDKNASRLRTSNAYSPLTSTASATAYGARSRAAGKRVTKQQKATAAAASDDVGIDKVLKDRLKKFGIFRSSSPPIAELNHSIVGTISANNHKDSAVNLARQEQHHHHHQQQQQQMAQFQVSQQQQQQQFRQQLQQQQKQQQHLATSSAAFYNSNPLSTSSRIPISSTTSVAEVLASVGSLNAKSRASATIAGDQTPMNVISGSAPATKYPFEMYVFGEMYAAEADAAKFLKRRGPRTSIKQEQLDLLNEIFATTPKPSKHARAKLAVQTGLSMRVIQVWFQNRRSKERRLKHLCNFLRHCERLDGAGEAKKFASCGDENFFTSLEAADFAEFLELKFRENFMDYEAASAAYSDSVVSDYNNPSSTIKNTNYIEKLECAYDVGAFPGKAPKNVMSGIIHSDKSGNVSDDNDDDGIEDKEDEDEFDNDTITVNTMPF